MSVVGWSSFVTSFVEGVTKLDGNSVSGDGESVVIDVSSVVVWLISVGMVVLSSLHLEYNISMSSKPIIPFVVFSSNWDSNINWNMKTNGVVI